MEEKVTESDVAFMAACYERFDPSAYLQYYYSPEEAHLEREDSFMSWILACLHRAFSEGDVRGEVLVDIGSGPALYQVMSACEVFNKIILTDFLEANRQAVRLWLQDGEGSGMDWTPYLQKVCELEGRRSSEWTEKAAELRKVVTNIVTIDVNLPHPLPHDVLPPFGADCLMSCFCMEGASPDMAMFNRALGNIGGLLRPGGHILLIGALEETYYLGGAGVKIPVLPLNEVQVYNSLKDNGFSQISLEVCKLPQNIKSDMEDMSGVFYAKARKN
ncbi:phenylethanolamine N-methyltransferase-like [Antennarius striatus]|uniref:phenylethanolamine N-methyltransferase-like n=1 Tax=Antennarius striatus TaxID=241820 RepID=UPI0035B31B61